MSTLYALAEQIEASAIGVAIAESRYAYPIIEGIHLIGLSISVGLIFLTDLRLMNLFMRRVPVIDVLRHLRPYVIGGFIAVFISGGLLFWSAAARMLDSPAFVAKMIFMALAGVNALYFELVIAQRAPVQDSHPVLPSSVAYAGVASFGLWTLVVVCGRLIPYLPSWG
jgi:hypothetical protein|nr:DUF6644 family protein [uncultured Steroidobacter sp.]